MRFEERGLRCVAGLSGEILGELGGKLAISGSRRQKVGLGLYEPKPRA